MKFVLMFVALSLASLLPKVSHAQDPTYDAPLFSSKRVSFGARAEYTWWDAAEGSVVPSGFHKEWGIGVPVSYALTAKRFADGHVGPPTLSATGRVMYYVDSRVTSWSLGLNLGLYDGGR